VELPFTVGNDQGEELTLVVGIDERATNRIDTVLGERELPPVHPPQDVFHAVLRFYDTVDGEWKWTYRDFRPVVRRDTFSVEYRLLVQRGTGHSILLRWAYPLPERIDSAVLSDRVTGTLVRIRFDQAQQASIENQFLEEFLLRVWYRIGEVSVVNEARELRVGPLQRVQLYDLLGRLCWEGERLPHGEELRLLPGVYVAVIQRVGGKLERFLWHSLSGGQALEKP